MIGVIISIRHENKKSKQDYIERIRPFITIDPVALSNIDFSKARDVIIHDDSENDKTTNSTVFYLKGFLFSNAGEAACIIDYLRINENKYECFYNIPVKPNESAQLGGYPLSLFIVTGDLKRISIGLSDRQSNQYEYELKYETMDVQKNEDSQFDKTIEIKTVDCSKNLLSSIIKKKGKKRHGNN